MGRFDGPHFESVGEAQVSIWAGVCSLDDLPEDYLDADFAAPDDAPWSPFSEEFGFGCFDEDLAEGNVSSTAEPVPIAELLQEMSYSETYRDAVVAAAKAKNVSQTAFVFMIFDFAYDPAVTGIERTDHMQFLGVFTYEFE